MENPRDRPVRVTLSFTMIIKGHFISSTNFIKSIVSQRFSRHARVRGHENRTEVRDLSCRSFSRVSLACTRSRHVGSVLVIATPFFPLATVPRIVYSSLASVSIWFLNSTQSRPVVLQPDLCCFPLCLNCFSSNGLFSLFECSTIVERRSNQRYTYGTLKSSSLCFSNVAGLLFQNRADRGFASYR